MSEKRKDNRGRILKTGESQRKDGTYQFRYTDPMNKRKTVYARTLQDLRKKEDEINGLKRAGINYALGTVSVYSIIERYLSLKTGLRRTTLNSYKTTLALIKNEPFSERCISEVKKSDVKLWLVDLSRRGKGYSAISSIFNITRAAFEMAVDDDILYKNPCSFKLRALIPDNRKKREALTDSQQKLWMDFLRTDNVYSRYYDEAVVLLGTGLRVSEFCGLTIFDLDFVNKTIRIDHQLQKDKDGHYYIDVPKTSSGVRFIPMSKEVEQSLRNLLVKSRRYNVETIVDGYHGFIAINNFGRPKTSQNIENAFAAAMKKFNKLHPDKPIPKVTPHVLRHTFCTNMANCGMNVNSLQYIMGHSSVTQTLSVYTHGSFEQARKEMLQIINAPNHGRVNNTFFTPSEPQEPTIYENL